MHHIILGAGGIGGGIGARLVQGGFDVTLIARGEHLARMQRDGLRLRTPEGDVTLPDKSKFHLDVAASKKPSAQMTGDHQALAVKVEAAKAENLSKPKKAMT